MAKGRKVPPALQQQIASAWDTEKEGFNLDMLWRAAGRPKGKEPINWIKGDGRAAVKRALTQGQWVVSDDPAVQAEVQKILGEIQA